MSEKEIYKWFIAHVAYRNESHVKDLFDIAGLECYMPFRSAVRTWKNKKIGVQVPVIPSCAFVRVAQSDFIMLQMMKEISLMKGSDDQPLSLSDEQMARIRQKLDVSNHPGSVLMEDIGTKENFVAL